ncbi:MAG: DUF5815 family protein [Halobacteriaceae archaeon]
MGEPTPGVPGTGDLVLELPCGERVDAVQDVDMGMREYGCSCGESHAVVMDVHPPSRFVPEDTVAVLREAVEVAEADRVGEFGTTHLMGMVREELPEEVVAVDVSETGAAGYAMVWMTAMDSRALHETVVELVVQLMEHAVSHGEDDTAVEEFEAQMAAFDVEEFVDRYRDQRDFEDEHDRAP